MPFIETDRQLLTRCLNRQPGGWEEFVDRFIGLFIHVIQQTAHTRSIKLLQDDIEDLCSEIFLTLIKKDFAVLRHFKGRSSLATYLAVVSRRIVVKAIAEKRKSEAMGHVALHRNAIGAAGSASEPVERLSNREEVQAMLEQLPASEAKIVHLYHLDSKTYQEISESMGIPMNSIGPTLHRARERMKHLSVRTG